jgi:trimethylamine-N-oxide reductase (cytochrome c)
MTVEEWAKLGYDYSATQDYVTWDELKDKMFKIIPTTPSDWKDTPRGLIDFYNDPEKNPLDTPSGLLEFYSERLEENFPDDEERGPYPKYVTGGPASEGWTHDESLWGERCKNYPLLLESNHCRWRNHVQFDDVPWLREIPTSKIRGYDGYLYEPYWINPQTAAERGIKFGDIIKVYNERGITLGGAYVTERMIPGAISADHGARLDFIKNDDEDYEDREHKWINRGGDNNIISPAEILSKNCAGMSTSSYLIEVEKLEPNEMEELRENYPQAFARDYDPAYGLLFNAWIEEEE